MSDPTPALSIVRVGRRTFLGSNGRGDQVLIGPEEVLGAFTPGELLKLALVGCAGMSADHRLTHALGADHAATLTVVGMKNDEDERYEHFDIALAADVSAVSEQRMPGLVARARAASGQQLHCGSNAEGGSNLQAADPGG